MGKANLTVNRLLERKDIFADFINGTLFCGEQVLKGDDLTLLSGHSGIIAEQVPGKKTGRRSEPNEIGQDMSGQDKMNQPKADTGKTGWDGPEPGHRRTCDRTFTGKLGAFERYGDIRMEAEPDVRGRGDGNVKFLCGQQCAASESV